MLRRLGTMILAGTTLLAPPSFCLQSQSRAPKPVLIRDTDTAEGKDEAEPSKEKEFNPHLADQNLKVGDFYFKRKNYGAALERYQDAIEYQPNLLAAYEALSRAHEKNGDGAKAVEAYREYLRRNPDSPKAPEVKSRIAKLEKRG